MTIQVSRLGTCKNPMRPTVQNPALDGDAAELHPIAAETTGDEEESAEDVWPTYQLPEQQVSTTEENVDEPADFAAETSGLQEPSLEEEVTDSSLSVWNADADATTDQPGEVIENTGLWNQDEAEEAFSDFSDEEEQASSLASLLNRRHRQRK